MCYVERCLDVLLAERNHSLTCSLCTKEIGTSVYFSCWVRGSYFHVWNIWIIFATILYYFCNFFQSANLKMMQLRTKCLNDFYLFSFFFLQIFKPFITIKLQIWITYRHMENTDTCYHWKLRVDMWPTEGYTIVIKEKVKNFEDLSACSYKVLFP